MNIAGSWNTWSLYTSSGNRRPALSWCEGECRLAFLTTFISYFHHIRGLQVLRSRANRKFKARNAAPVAHRVQAYLRHADYSSKRKVALKGLRHGTDLFRAFEVVDADDDGIINFKEFSTALQFSGANLTSEEVTHLFNQVRLLRPCCW